MSLNSKKSWHPAKAINRAKVQKLEEDELKRRKQEEARVEELEHERRALHLRNQTAEPSNDKLAWIYDTKQNTPLIPRETDSSDGSRGSAGARNASYASLYGLSMDSPIAKKQSARKRAADPLQEMIRRTRERIQSRSKTPANRKTDRISKRPVRRSDTRS